MSAAARIGGFVALLAVIFAAAALAGAELSPGVDEATEEHQQGDEAMNGHTVGTDRAGTDQHDTAATAVSQPPPGLAVAHGDYRLVPAETTLQAGHAAEYSFRIVDAEGATVSDFDVEHERRMHLIVIRRDFEGFQHLHPEQLDDGGWSAAVDTHRPGVYRAFADFASGGESLTLASDLFVAGEFDPESLPAVSTTADAGDGYSVELSAQAPEGGDTGLTRFQVSLDGKLLASVQPYLGADGHLVALREHDQAFLHTHPQGEAGGNGPIAFQVEYPSAGNYRLFLQFKHAGEVRTAAFTQTATEQAEVEHGG